MFTSRILTPFATVKESECPLLKHTKARRSRLTCTHAVAVSFRKGNVLGKKVKKKEVRIKRNIMVKKKNCNLGDVKRIDE